MQYPGVKVDDILEDCKAYMKNYKRRWGTMQGVELKWKKLNLQILTSKNGEAAKMLNVSLFQRNDVIIHGDDNNKYIKWVFQF